MIEFYSGRGYTAAWFDEEGLTEPAFQMYITALNSGRYGVSQPTLYRDELINMFDDSPSQKTMLPIDFMLTSQYFHHNKVNFSSELTNKEMKSLDWLIPREKSDPVQLLTDIIDNKSEIFKEASQRTGYKKLKDELIRIRVKGLDKLTPIKTGKKIYEAGDSAEVLRKVRERLFILGDLSRNSNSVVLDSGLTSGIKNFQIRHGLEPDGVAGPAFFEELNVSGRKRVMQILTNLERYRWMSDNSDSDYILVNIPEFKMYAYHNDSAVWDMNVIVGKELNKTVIFEGDITYIVFSPYWNLPPSIVRKEIMPAMKKNKNYLEEHNMEITGYKDGIPDIRQRPGENNSLGKVKFMFPNSHSIYLHDSPVKNLFAKVDRSYSHGCVRVGNAEFLANYLLRNQKNWTPKKTHNAMNSSTESIVNLEKPMPVYLTYFTAFIDKNGRLNFRKDIYNRDRKLQDLLFQ
ncbi:MAG: L,D-transpeptidase family protein [Paludibacteraceae bacterium]